MKNRTPFYFNDGIKIDCFTGRYGQGMAQKAEVYQNGRLIGKCNFGYLNRTWESFTYESVLLKVSRTFFNGGLDKEIDDIAIGKAKDAETWFDNFKKDYDGLHENTKQHLANALSGHFVTSTEEADEIMKISKAFDFLLNM